MAIPILNIGCVVSNAQCNSSNIDIIWSSFKKKGKNIVTQLETGEIWSNLNTQQMCKQLSQISTRNRNSQHFSGRNQRHWKLGCHAINHWVIFHSLFYMFLVSNKQLVFPGCSSDPFAVHKLSAGSLRTSSATPHRKTLVFLCGGCKSHLNSFIHYFWHPIYII